MAEDLKQGEALWRNIAGKSPTRKNLQAQYVEMEADGIEISQFLMVNMGLAKANDLDLPSRMNPEHYYFDATPNGEQVIVETFGEYRYPTYLHLYPIDGDDTWFPAKLDADTMLAMTGETHLAVDDTDTKIIGMHQFKPKKGGLKVKLGVFLPEAAPSEILEGHAWHLLIEFNNCMHLAATKRPNAVQRFAIDRKLKGLQKHYAEVMAR